MDNEKAALKVVDELREAGFSALLAGGCVRDMLLGRAAKDHDVATDAKPQEVSKLFRRTIEVGAKFGVVVVMMRKEQVEVATFRTESGYADGRHPENVEYSDAKHDAQRRDFTINGMFYDPADDEVLDYVGGKDDLERKVIRTIGDADERFGEDYLRMLRAVRFSTELGFEIEDETWRAVCKNPGNILKISGERVAMELAKILAADGRSRGVRLLIDCGLAEAVFAGFGDGGAAMGVKVLEGLESEVDFALGLAGFFAGYDTDFAMAAADALKLSNDDGRRLRWLLDNEGALLDGEMGLAELKLFAGEDGFEDICRLQEALQRAKGESCEGLEVVMRRAAELNGVDLRPKPLLDGHELIKLGTKPGPMVGKVADAMYRAQLGDEISTVEEGREWVLAYLAENKG
jgi:tRNA nucleotidyltransferase/poly(A) polymerase